MEKENCRPKEIVINGAGGEFYHVLIPNTNGSRKTLCGRVLNDTDFIFPNDGKRYLCGGCSASKEGK